VRREGGREEGVGFAHSLFFLSSSHDDNLYAPSHMYPSLPPSLSPSLPFAPYRVCFA